MELGAGLPWQTEARHEASEPSSSLLFFHLVLTLHRTYPRPLHPPIFTFYFAAASEDSTAVDFDELVSALLQLGGGPLDHKMRLALAIFDPEAAASGGGAVSN